jgi:hypothetical protein
MHLMLTLLPPLLSPPVLLLLSFLSFLLLTLLPPLLSPPALLLLLIKTRPCPTFSSPNLQPLRKSRKSVAPKCMR